MGFAEFMEVLGLLLSLAAVMAAVLKYFAEEVYVKPMIKLQSTVDGLAQQTTKEWRSVDRQLAEQQNSLKSEHHRLDDFSRRVDGIDVRINSLEKIVDFRGRR